MAGIGFEVSAMRAAREVAERSNLIVTSTPTRTPFLFADSIQPGTHITAVGADQAGKQELDPGIVARAGAIVVDSITQCSEYGEISHALNAGLIRLESLVEIGTVLASGQRARDDSDATQITLADLTGVAVQDAQIAFSIVGLP
jgi:ornithine cyclodeaminase